MYVVTASGKKIKSSFSQKILPGLRLRFLWIRLIRLYCRSSSGVRKEWSKNWTGTCRTPHTDAWPTQAASQSRPLLRPIISNYFWKIKITPASLTEKCLFTSGGRCTRRGTRPFIDNKNCVSSNYWQHKPPNRSSAGYVLLAMICISLVIFLPLA